VEQQQGCWTSKFADLKNTAALADALRDIGFATWNLEYRREDNAGGGWPGTFEDIASATDFLRNISTQYSLDLNKVIVIGHSAGGHLALWLSGRHQLASTSQLYNPNPLPLHGVISLAGVPDLQAFRKQGEKICGADVIGRLLGENEEQIASRYNDASPINLLPLKVQQVLIFGTEDKAVPDMFDNYILMAKKSGDSIKLIHVKFAGHHEYNVPNSITWPSIQSAVKSLVNE
jgi:pimeloyl-ACP methyl ester carboxylesterase